MLEKVSDGLAQCANSDMTASQYHKGTFWAVTGIFCILLILLAALVLAASNQTPWEER